MKESVLQKSIIDYCKKNRIYCVNIHGGGWCAKGVPDLLLCVNGRFLALELKVKNNAPQDDQIIHKSRILVSGGIWSCPRNLADAVSVIEDVRNGKSIYHT